MYKAKIAPCLPKPKWLEIDGSKVLGKEEALYYMVEIEFTHPDYFITEDDVGNNTQHRGFKNGNQTYVARKVQQACILCATD